jgi:hypothetical protein
VRRAASHQAAVDITKEQTLVSSETELTVDVLTALLYGVIN